MTSATFEKRIEKIFRGYTITQYRENKGRKWIEFYYQATNLLDTNTIRFKDLDKLRELLSTMQIEVNAWTEIRGCSQCAETQNYGYVVAMGVEF